jgi:hypothetical protein
MAIIYPYSLSFFADKLKISGVTWDIKRNDEMSGLGSGMFFQAELAPPLWTGDVSLDTRDSDELKQIAALIRKLHGAQEAFFLYDPLSKYPQADPTGSILGSNVVQVAEIGADFDRISLKGLPAGYVLTLGDKVQIAHGSAPVRYAFLEVSETVVADGSGITAEFHVFPHVPVALAIDDVATLKKAACRVVIQPSTHNPGKARHTITEGATFKVIQKK